MKNEVTLSPDGKVAYLKLTQGQTAIVDAEALARMEQHRWYAMRKKGSDRYYAVTNARGDDGKLRGLQLGRFLTMADLDDRVVYANNNPLDNRMENLNRLEKRSLGVNNPDKIDNDGTYVLVNLLKGCFTFVETDSVFMLAEHKWKPLPAQWSKLLVDAKEEPDVNYRRLTQRKRNNSTGFKGVSYRKRDGRYAARISIHGKIKSLGTYPSPELAYAAYCTAAAWHYGANASFDPEPPEGSVEEWMLV